MRILARTQKRPLTNIMTQKSDSTANIFTRYKGQLLKFIRSRVNILEDAEDILQDVFYQYARLNELADPVRLTVAWLYKVARNKIVDYYKKKRAIPFSDLLKSDDDEVVDFLAIDNNTPETEAEHALFWDALNDALKELPLAQREVFILTEFEGLSYAEVAKVTGASESALRSRKHYAVVFLRERLRRFRE